MTALPPIADLTDAGTKQSEAQTYFTAIRNYLLGVIGVAGTPAAGRTALGLGNVAEQTLGTGAGNVALNSDHSTEQTWTPVLAGSTVPGAIVYDIQVGRRLDLTLVGLTIATFHLRVIGGALGAQGNALITGLPFTSKTTANVVQAVTIGLYSGITFTAGYTQFTGQILPNTTQIQFIENGKAGDDAAFINITQLDLADNFVIRGTAIYYR